MSSLSEYLDNYERKNPGWRERADAKAAAFWADVPEIADLTRVPFDECAESHRGPEGPNEDMASCPKCWGLTWAMRPDGESFGWHLADCSLPLRHESYCRPGGDGHPIPDGWKLRG